jgi:hypothetical protein
MDDRLKKSLKRVIALSFFRVLQKNMICCFDTEESWYNDILLVKRKGFAKNENISNQR